MRLFSTFTPAFVLAFAWMVFFVVAENMALRFPCPRCGKWFFAKWWYHNKFCTAVRFTVVCRSMLTHGRKGSMSGLFTTVMREP